VGPDRDLQGVADSWWRLSRLEGDHFSLVLTLDRATHQAELPHLITLNGQIVPLARRQREPSLPADADMCELVSERYGGGMLREALTEGIWVAVPALGDAAGDLDTVPRVNLSRRGLAAEDDAIAVTRNGQHLDRRGQDVPYHLRLLRGGKVEVALARHTDGTVHAGLLEQRQQPSPIQLALVEDKGTRDGQAVKAQCVPVPVRWPAEKTVALPGHPLRNRQCLSAPAARQVHHIDAARRDQEQRPASGSNPAEGVTALFQGSCIATALVNVDGEQVKIALMQAPDHGPDTPAVVLRRRPEEVAVRQVAGELPRSVCPAGPQHEPPVARDAEHAHATHEPRVRRQHRVWRNAQRGRLGWPDGRPGAGLLG